MNPNEVDFVMRGLPNQPLTDMAAQFNCATLAPSGSQAGFRLPMGYGNDTDCLGNRMVFGDGTGTIELKAAWLILPPNDPNKSRYLTAQAQVTDPNGVTSTQTVGLVGLHIIRRMPELAERPIIAFSAKMDAQRAAECRAMGFDAAIQKDADLSLAVADVLLAA
jgi:hypothetical protein